MPTGKRRRSGKAIKVEPGVTIVKGKRTASQGVTIVKSKRTASLEQENKVQREKKKKKIKVEEEEGTEEVKQLVQLFVDARNIIVLVGAGISRSCGIPDFRSKEGIYRLVEELDLGLPQPECLFDLDYFTDDPEPFYKFAHVLYPKKMPSPSLTHRFLLALEKSKKLVRVYTQNIDGLESAAGVGKVIQCHGSLRGHARCIRCKHKHESDVVRIAAEEQKVAYCSNVKKPNCGGVLKPDIVFFGEPVGTRVGQSLGKDIANADLLIVMGTSLQVAPMSGVLELAKSNTPTVLINKDPIKLRKSCSRGFDLELFGDCDKICGLLANALKQRLPSRVAKNFCIK